MTQRITLTADEAKMYGDPPADEPEYPEYVGPEPIDPPSANGRTHIVPPPQPVLRRLTDIDRRR